MSAGRYVQTRFLVLRLTPYADTSLVVAGLSPEVGQLHFMVRGARRLGPRQFPMLDLFRLLQVSYRDTDAELHRLVSADLMADYGALARRFPAFQAASWLARFALANVVAGVGHEALFEALCVGFGRLAEPPVEGEARSGTTDAVIVGVCLTYLQEAGWLAAPDADAAAERQCRCLLEMAAGGPPPRLTLGNWQQLREWVLSQARNAGCQIPGEA